MVALYIILGILLLLFLISLIRIEVFAKYTDVLSLDLKILFVRLHLIKPKENKTPKKQAEPKKDKKPQAPKKEKRSKEKKPSYLTKLKEKKGLSGVVSLITSLARIAAGALKGIFSHIVIKVFNVGIALSGEDAASTAVTYGRLCAVIYPAVDIITAATVCDSYNVTVEPVFDPDRDTQIYADVHAYIRVLFLLVEAIKAGVKLLIVRIKL